MALSVVDLNSDSELSFFEQEHAAFSRYRVFWEVKRIKPTIMCAIPGFLVRCPAPA